MAFETGVPSVPYLGTSRKYVVDLADGSTLQARIGVRLDRSPLTAGDRVQAGWDLTDSVVVTDRDDAKEHPAPHLHPACYM